MRTDPMTRAVRARQLASTRAARTARSGGRVAATVPGAAPVAVTDRLLLMVRRVVDGALVVLVALGLATVVLGRLLPLAGHPVLIVAGPSMEPTLPLGSAVVLRRVAPGELRVGDVASVRTGPRQAIFTHRITRVVERDGAPWIETRGDANATVDPSLTPASAVVGRVDLWLPAAGYLLTLVSSPVGVCFALSLGGMLLVAGWLLDDLLAARRRRGRAADPVRLERPSLAARPMAGAG